MFDPQKREVISQCLKQGVGCFVYHRKPNVVSAVMVVTHFRPGFAFEGDKLTGDSVAYEGTEIRTATKPIPIHQIEQVWMAHPSGH